MVDVIFADVAQPDQARIVSINASHFLKNQGHFVISIKVCCNRSGYGGDLVGEPLGKRRFWSMFCNSVVRTRGRESLKQCVLVQYGPCQFCVAWLWYTASDNAISSWGGGLRGGDSGELKEGGVEGRGGRGAEGGKGGRLKVGRGASDHFNPKATHGDLVFTWFHASLTWQ